MAFARGVAVVERGMHGRVLIAVALLLGSAAWALGAQDFPDEKPATAATSKSLPTVTAPAQPKAAPEKPKSPPRPTSRKSTPEPVVVRIPSARSAPIVPTDATAANQRSAAQGEDAAAEPGGSSTPQLGVPEEASTPSFVSALEAVPQNTGPLQLLGETIESGSRHELRWGSSQSFDGAVVTTPVIVLHGVKPGPRLCMTAAVHGDELNGIEIIRRVTNEIDVAELAGTVIAVPIVNYLGYSRASRYLPDRRDLNRYFPGTRTGSSASRIAFGFFHDIARHCHALVDFHTGSFDRSNLPQVRGDLRGAAVLAFTREFGATAVLHSPGSSGMLRRALTDVGIPAITFEVGSPLRLEPSEIDFGVQAMHTLMHKMGMTRSFRMWAEPQALFYAAKWVRADSGGMLFSEVKLGDRVRAGQRLGKVIDPIQNLERAIVSPVRGKVLGMALNQIVLPGFAAYHLGVETSEQRMAEEAARAAANVDGGSPGVDDPAEDDGAGTPVERAPEDEDSER